MANSDCVVSMLMSAARSPLGKGPLRPPVSSSTCSVPLLLLFLGRELLLFFLGFLLPVFVYDDLLVLLPFPWP